RRNVRIVLRVSGEHECDYLRLITETFREKGSDRPINQSAGENLALAGTTFTLDKSAGNAAASVGVLPVIDREWEEVDTFPRIGIGNCGGQNDVVAHANHGRPVCLLCQSSSFK